MKLSKKPILYIILIFLSFYNNINAQSPYDCETRNDKLIYCDNINQECHTGSEKYYITFRFDYIGDCSWDGFFCMDIDDINKVYIEMGYGGCTQSNEDDLIGCTYDYQWFFSMLEDQVPDKVHIWYQLDDYYEQPQSNFDLNLEFSSESKSYKVDNYSYWHKYEDYEILIYPLSKLELNEQYNSITCVDFNNPDSPILNESFGINWSPLGEDYNEKDLDMQYDLMYRIAGEGSEDWKVAVEDLKEFGSIDLNDFIYNNPELLSHELEFHIKHSVGESYFDLGEEFGSKILPCYTIYQSNIITGVFFIETPKLAQFDYLPPSCTESNDASMTLTFPDLPSSTMDYRLTVSCYTKDISNGASEKWPDKNGDTYYFDGGLTSNVTVSKNNNTITIDNTYLSNLSEEENGGDNPLELKAGLYKFEVFINDASVGSLCPNVFWEEVKPPTPVIINSYSIQDKITASGSGLPDATYQAYSTSDTGSALLQISGGTGKYRLQGTSESLTNSEGYTIEGLSASVPGITHTIKIEDTNGCDATSSPKVTIKCPNSIGINVTKKPPVYLCGNATTSIKYKVAGGVGPFTSTLKKGGSNVSGYSNIKINDRDEKTISGLKAGSYVLTIKDGDSPQSEVTETYSFTIASRKIPNVSLTPKNTSYCDKLGSDGSISISASNGSGSNYTYHYKKTSASTYQSNTSSNITNLGIGTYQVYVSNSGCSSTIKQATISSRTLPSITLSGLPKDHICEQKGSVSFNISGVKLGENYTVEIVNENKDSLIIKNTGNVNGTSFNSTFDKRLNGSTTGINYYGKIIVDSKNKGCIEHTSSAFEVKKKSNPLSSIGYKTVADESCYKKANAVIELTNADKIKGDYTVSGGGTLNSTTNQILGLSASKSYKFTIEETTGRKCTHTFSVKDLKVSNDSLSAEGNNNKLADCSESKTGSIIVNASGGRSANGQSSTSNYKFYLNDTLKKTQKSSSYSFSGLPNGSDYEIKVIDDSGCEVSEYVSVGTHQNSPVTIEIPTDVKDYYCEKSKGSFSIKATTRNAGNNLKYTITGGSNTYDDKTNTDAAVEFTKLNAGVYTVTVEDKGVNCTNSYNVSIDDKDYDGNIEITSTTTESPVCDIASNGKVGIDYSSPFTNSSGLTLSMDGGTSSTNINFDAYYVGLGVGSYNITVTDSYTCSNTIVHEVVKSDDAVTLSDPTITIPSCQKATNGSIEITASQGVPFASGNYTVKLFDSQGDLLQTQTGTTVQFNNISTGTYHVFVEDMEKCSYTSNQFSVGYHPNIVLSNPSTVDPKCNGGTDGSISIDIQNDDYPGAQYNYIINRLNVAGTQYEPYSAFFNKIGNKGTFSGLSAGEYQIMVQQQGEVSVCFNIIYAEIEEPLKIKLSDLSYSCISTNGGNDGRFTISVSEGSKKYSYQWLKDGNIVENKTSGYNDIGAFVFEKTGLSAGTYTFRLNDVKRCNYFDGSDIYEHTVVISQPSEALTLTADITHESCTGEEDGRVVLNASGGWLCSENDHNGCTNPAHNNCPNWQSGAGTSCSTADYLYSYGNNTSWECRNVFSGLPPGDHKFYVKDKAGNIAQQTITINARPLLTLNLVNDFDASCPGYNNGRVEALVNNGVKDNGNFNYTIASTDAGSSFADVILTNDESFNYNHLPKGNYQLTVSDLNGCTDNTNFTVNEPEHAELTVTHNYIKDKDDATGEIQVNIIKGNGVFDYRVVRGATEVYSDKDNETGSISLTGLIAGTYLVEVRDTAGCLYESTEWMQRAIEIQEPDQSFHFSLQEKKNVSCKSFNNGWINAVASGGWGTDYTYSLNGAEEQASGSYSNLVPGDYTVEIKDTAGITRNWDFTITEPDTLVMTVQDDFDASCPNYANGQVHATVSNGVDFYNGLSYQITNVDNTSLTYGQTHNFDRNYIFNHLPKGSYEIAVTDSNACYASDFFDIGEPDTATISLTHNYIRAKDDATGFIDVQIEKGNGLFDYQWLYNGEAMAGQSGQTTGALSMSNLLAGTYTLEVQDTAKCNYEGEEWMTRNIVIQEPEDALQFSMQQLENVSCKSFGNGSVEAIAAGGWGNDYMYTLNGAQQQNNGVYTNLTPGSYTLQITDTVGITHDWNFEITEPDTFTVSVNNTFDATCPMYANGRVEATINNGIDHYNGLQYTIQNIHQPEVVFEEFTSERLYQFGLLPKGEYEITVRDSNLCVDTDVFSIGEPDTATISIDHNYIRAKGESTGNIAVNINNGNQWFDYQWLYNNNPLEQGQVANNLSLHDIPAGEYKLMVRDTAGCVYEQSEWMERTVQIREPDKALRFDLVVNEPVSCFELSNGRIEVNPVGGWGDYTLVNNTEAPQTNGLFNDLIAGEYHITITDSTGISWDSTIVVVQPDLLTSSYLSHKDINCYGGSDGDIRLNVNGGNGGYHISIDEANWQEGTSVENLPIGTYNLYIKDEKNCEASVKNIVLTQPDLIEVAHDTIIKSRCSNNEGTIETEFKGGVGAYNYQWYKLSDDNTTETLLEGETNANISDLYSARYKILVTDEHLCTLPFEFVVGDITDLAIDTIKVTPVTCFGYSDGNAKALVIKGNAPYYYSWPSSITHHDNDTVWGIVSDEYELLVRDNKGCSASKKFTIETPDPLEYDTISFTDPLCYGGVQGIMKVQAKGGTTGYEYTWTNGSVENQVTDVEPGNYDLTITDGHNCVADFNIDFDYQRTLTPFIGNDTLICHYDSLIINPGSYHTYNLVSDAGYHSTLARPVIKDPSVYYLQVTDEDHCLGFDTLSLDVSYLNISNFKQKDVTCNKYGDGNAQIEISPAGWDHVIRWSDGSNKSIWNNLSGGDYRVDINDGFGCKDSVLFSIYEPDTLNYNINQFKHTLCYGNFNGVIEGEIQGGVQPYNILWNNGLSNESINQLDTGYYRIDVTDANNCFYQKEFNLEYQRYLTPFIGNDTLICSYDSLVINPGEYHTYSLVSDDGYSSNLSTPVIKDPSIYYLQVTDVDNCLGYDTLTLDVSYLSISDFNQKDVTCNKYADGSAQISVSPIGWNHTIYWPDGSGNTSWNDLSGGEYKVSVTDDFGCVDSKDFSIFEPDTLNYAVSAIQDPLCLGNFNGFINGNITGGVKPYNFNWNNGAIDESINQLDTGYYRIDVTDANNCFYQKEFDLSYRRILTPFVGNDTLICHYNALPVDAGSYNKFSWSSINGFTSRKRSIEIKDPDTYYLQVTDVDKCLGFDTIKVDLSYLKIDDYSSIDVTCNGDADGSAQIQVSPMDWSHSVLWSNGSNQYNIDGLSGGSYSVRVWDTYGCEDNQSFSIYEPDPLSITLNLLQVPLCFGVENGQIKVTAEGGRKPFEYQWLHGENDNNINKLDTGLYVLDVYDKLNCHIRKEYDMRYETAIYPQLGEDQVICEGNNVRLYPGNFEDYKWSNTLGHTAIDTAWVVTDKAEYYVEVTDERDCVGRDTIKVDTRATDLTPEFLMASSVPAGDTLMIIEVSQPKPQSFSWNFSGKHHITEESDFYCKVIFEEEGNYEVILNANSYNCMAQARKSILVTPTVEHDEDGGQNDVASRKIISLVASPNPSNGNFNAKVKLSETLDATYYVVRIENGQIIEKRKVNGLDTYNEDFNINTPGIYAVFVEVGDERRVTKVLVQ